MYPCPCAPLPLPTVLRVQWVAPGTNGGMSLGGTLASVGGGAAVGAAAGLIASLAGPEDGPGTLDPESALAWVAFGALWGLLGSLVDSILGATLQASWFDKVWAKRVRSVCLVGGKVLSVSASVRAAGLVGFELLLEAVCVHVCVHVRGCASGLRLSLCALACASVRAWYACALRLSLCALVCESVRA